MFNWGGPFWTTYFVSNPLDVNSNSKKNLGISKGETFWKCYIGEHEAPTADDVAHEFEISLEKFSTDIPRRIDTIPRRIDTSCIEDSAKMLFSMVGMIALMIFA